MIMKIISRAATEYCKQGIKCPPPLPPGKFSFKYEGIYLLLCVGYNSRQSNHCNWRGTRKIYGAKIAL